MKLEEMKQLQPELVDRFTHILENGHLSHAYLFTGSFASFEMALFLHKATFAKTFKEYCRVANAGTVP